MHIKDCDVSPNLTLSRTGVVGTIWSAALFSGVLSLLQLALPIYSMQIFDRVLPSDSLPTLAALSLIMIGLTIFSVFLDASRSIALGRVAARVDRALHARTMTHIFEAQRDGSATTKDIETIRMFIGGPLATIVLDAPWSAAFLTAIFMLHPLLGWLTAGASCLMLGLGVLSHSSTRMKRGQMAQASTITSGLLTAIDQQADTSAAMGMQRRLFRQLMALRLRATDIGVEIGERHAWIDSAGRGVRSILQVGVLALAASLVLAKGMQVGAIVASSMLFARALAPIERLGSSFHAIANFCAAWRRAAKLLNVPQCKTPNFNLPEIRPYLTVHNVSLFLPQKSSFVLERVCFKANPGEVLVVVGREGAGKSSLVKILAGAIRPTHGDFRIDGSNVADFDQETLGRQVGYVSDSPGLLVGPIGTIISRGEAAQAEEVIQAAQLAGVHSIIQALPQGYNTRYDDHSNLLSAGHRQRLALARAFYNSPRLLVLDEPATHLDDSGEMALCSAIRHLKASGSTVIVVSRLPALLHLADRLLMLDQGVLKLSADQADIQRFVTPRLAASNI